MMDDDGGNEELLRLERELKVKLHQSLDAMSSPVAAPQDTSQIEQVYEVSIDASICRLLTN